MGANPRHGKVPDLGAPLRINRLFQAEHPQIQCEIRYIQELAVAAERWTRREKQSVGQAMIVNAFEVPQLCNELPAGTDHHDLIALIGSHPEVVMAVDGDAVGPVDAVDEHARGPRISVGNWDLYYRIISRIGREHEVAGVIELNPVRSERRNARSGKQGIADPNCPRAAARPGLPDDALEGVRHVHVSGLIEG